MQSIRPVSHPLSRLVLTLATGLAVAAPSAACGDDAKSSPADTGDTTTTDVADAADVTDTRSDSDARETSSTPCDPILQTGCEAGANCTFIGAETVATCVPAGPVPANNACSPEDRCQRGVCLSINQTGNRCYQVCGEDTDCGAGTANECITLSSTPYSVCKIPGLYTQCNLLTQNCTDVTKACYAVAGEAEPICLLAGTGATGSECASAGTCVKGQACVNSVCRALCDPDVAASCGATATCRDFFDDAGYCAPN